LDIERGKPKVAITFIDNSYGIMRLKQLFSNIPFKCVQNGLTIDMMHKTCTLLNFDNYYSFGLAEIDIIDNFWHAANYDNSIGSLRLGIFSRGVSSIIQAGCAFEIKSAKSYVGSLPQ